ncbi:ankyrin repeat family A protein 2-like isoform X1 [Argiope bruennichi]|uniref:Ankyrin repeat family A protein 2 like protein n=1 Tax=Argiope bruennichi TaxID=94029 RepID=A0A8T0FIF7_ARGBR|nr:ankyrin repeat family A protein 2-like isoform X1 [Argiope bruennichi]XP_055929803.1 ankyrin repeat family A protein 2-like isoform X1 [Argiope bruennichi]XP_055929804.1 ankyrin repeat family A protein 2-like isoform X1 [Argiope bruennichi]KAF8790232.1 Ankyrin repeat family A protein 2 like protein [Argiope bruennichi]
MPSSIFVKKENEDSQPSVSFSSAMGISSLNRDGSRSAFTPYKPTTVLTNLQRGNVQTQTPAVLPERSIYQLAAQGELFLQSNAMNDSFDPNQTDQNGLTPLMWASSYGQLATVQKLISCGASISTIGDSGENALILASSAGHSVIVKELINQGASLDYRDQEGNTALMYAVYNNRAGCVQELLNAGADMTIVNEALESAYEIAIKKRCREAQTVMEKHMLNLMQADVNLVQVKTEPL